MFPTHELICVKLRTSLHGFDEHSAVTIDLTGPAMIRARGGDEQRCTDVALPDSRCDGKPIRWDWTTTIARFFSNCSFVAYRGRSRRLR